MAHRKSPRAGNVGPYHWKVRSGDPRITDITREGTNYKLEYWAETTEGTEKFLRGTWRRETVTTAALESGDPLALCRLGWHRLHEDFLERGSFFWWMGGVRIGERMNFWVGREPFTWSSTMVAGLGPQAVPWKCCVCNKFIPEKTWKP